ncbi:MAG TPA: hemerythrin domain-containing protein [Polyangia bacterium]|nr:hemerythrin domain-containing protein [Polyangia bacterium]
MDAIALLKSQHRKVETLFSKIESAKDQGVKQRLFSELADNLAGHATIEERHFYPAVRAKQTEDILLESLEEHLGIKRVIADLLKLDAGDETYDAKLTVLKEQVEHHVGEEEKELFPKVKKLFDKADLETLGEAMQADFERLEAGHPAEDVPSETDHAAPL